MPHGHTLDVSQADGRPTPGSAVNPSYIYRLPLWSLFPYNIGCPALGIARGALEEYVQQTAARADKAAAVARHLRISEAAAEIDAAEALLLADAADVGRFGRVGEPPAIELRTKWRRDISFAVSLCVRAVERLAITAGAHAVGDSNPLQRAFRDVCAVANHTGLVWDNNGPLFGRVAIGLDALDSPRRLPV